MCGQRGFCQIATYWESHAPEGIEEIIAPKRWYRPPSPLQHPLYLLSDLKLFCRLAFVLSSRSSRYCLVFFFLLKVIPWQQWKCSKCAVVTEVHKTLRAPHRTQTIFVCLQVPAPHIVCQWLIKHLGIFIQAITVL